jgi:hypothetical protein
MRVGLHLISLIILGKTGGTREMVRPQSFVSIATDDLSFLSAFSEAASFFLQKILDLLLSLEAFVALALCLLPMPPTRPWVNVGSKWRSRGTHLYFRFWAAYNLRGTATFGREPSGRPIPRPTLRS